MDLREAPIPSEPQSPSVVELLLNQSHSQAGSPPRYIQSIQSEKRCGEKIANGWLRLPGFMCL
jgi:hypothetical protein